MRTRRGRTVPSSSARRAIRKLSGMTPRQYRKWNHRNSTTRKGTRWY